MKPQYSRHLGDGSNGCVDYCTKVLLVNPPRDRPID
jgi:hypothetical protein